MPAEHLAIFLSGEVQGDRLDIEGTPEARAMELTLRYSGLLPSNGSTKEKQDIRLHLHEQLESLWAEDRRLREIYEDLKNLQIPARSGPHFEVDRPIAGPKFFWWRWPLCGYNFIPLVTHVHELHCFLRIRIYRKVGPEGILFAGGDLDNRLKTLLDALQVPSEASQLPKSKQVSNDPSEWPPLFCLLDDDRAVTKLSIESIKLLSPIPPEYSGSENYVEMDIDATIAPASAIMGNVDMLFQ